MKWIYPYKTLFGDVMAKVGEVRIDGEVPPRSLADPDAHEVDLADVERAGWHTASLNIEVVGPASELSQHEGCRAIVTAHCSLTHTRQMLVLSRSGDARWSGALVLDREFWYGRITLRCLLTATVEAVPHRVIGLAPEWRVDLDDLPQPSVHGSIPVLWDDFTSPTRLPALSEYPAEPFFLHLDPERPTLYLNLDFRGLPALLSDTRRRQPAEQALRDETRSAIATQAWMGMFNAAVLGIAAYEDGGVDWPESDWQRAVLELLLPRMRPLATADEALREIHAMTSEGDGGRALQQAAMPAISAHVGAGRLLREAIRKLGSEISEDGHA